MKKKWKTDVSASIRSIQKLLLIMRLTIFLTFLLTLTVSAGTYSQNTRLDLSLENVTIEHVLLQIENNSRFIFIYESGTIDKSARMSISVKEKTIDEILATLFQGTDVEYHIDDRQVLLYRKDNPLKNINLAENPLVPAQQLQPVSGKVMDISGAPLPGVTVVVKGTTQGIITDFDGKYALSDIPSNATLVFSFVGMATQEFPVASKTVINVRMEEETIGIEEVVAIGYGSVKKKDLTGAISSLGGDKLIARQTPQIGTALQGALPGVMVTRNNSRPGGAVTIRVRGITSMTSNDPLIIVDGVPTGSIDDVNPADIENLTVLKDAASASIYGSRAAAGVILITTKRGMAGKESIDYNYSYSMNYQTKIPDYADAPTYMRIFNEMLWNDNPAGGEYIQYSKDLIDNYWTLNKQNPDQYPNTNWVDMTLRNFAQRQSHQLSIATGKDNLRTNLSIGYVDEDGLLVENQSWQRMTARLNNNLSIGRWFATTFDLNLKRELKVDPAFDYFYRMRYEPPIFAGIYSDGRLAGGYNGTNVYGKMAYGGTDETADNQVDGKISIDIKPLKGLTITGLFAPKFNFYKGKLFNKQVPYYSAWDDTETTELLDGTETTKLKETRVDSYSIVSQAYANYVKNIGKHSFSLMLGYENYYFFHENVMASRGEYDFTYYPYLDAGPGHMKDNAGDAYENALRSALGRFMYNWDSRYLIQANFRYDGSSRFHPDYRWGFFPSVSAGWVVSEEGFLKDNSLISHLKLRASWGQLGDQRIGNYPYQSTLSFNNPTLYAGNAVTSVQGASAYQYPVRDITWQTTETTGVGIDLNTFKNRLNFSGDYYRKQTKDMLLKLQIPTFMGYSDPYQNAGKMSTKGWDVDLAWNDKIRDFRYGISFNISHHHSEMGYLKDTRVESGGTIIQEGSEYYEWYGYLSDGIYQTAEEVAGSPVTSGVVTIGDVRYKDISGPDGVPDGIINTNYDRVLLGGSYIPRLNYGGNINLEYKGFDFLLSCQGVGERKSMLTDEMVQPIRSDLYNVPEIILGKYWSHYNSDAQNANARYPRATRTGISNNYAVSDFWLINGAYFRIKNITLGYTLPKKLMGKTGVNKVRFYASLSDFFTISHFPTGWDPEVSSTNYPITKTVTFGASVRF